MNFIHPSIHPSQTGFRPLGPSLSSAWLQVGQILQAHTEHFITSVPLLRSFCQAHTEHFISSVPLLRSFCQAHTKQFVTSDPLLFFKVFHICQPAPRATLSTVQGQILGIAKQNRSQGYSCNRFRCRVGKFLLAFRISSPRRLCGRSNHCIVLVVLTFPHCPLSLQGSMWVPLS